MKGIVLAFQIKELPFGSTRHVLTRAAFAEDDPVYHQFLRKLGFRNSMGHLGFVVEGDSLELLGAGITAMLASEKNK